MYIKGLLTGTWLLTALAGLSAQRCDFTGAILPSLQVYTPTTGRDILPVPVVFHVLYKNAGENISDNQILSQLDILNADYNAANADLAEADPAWRQLSGSAGLRFCLYAEGGIRRKQIPESPDPGFSVFYSQSGGDDAVLPEKVLNIWITPLKRPLLGFANPPHQYPLAESGVVADYRCVGNLGAALHNQPYHLGRTLTHEIGHYFGLLHVWGNLEMECTEDDGIQDTPPQYTALYDCPAPVSGCNASANTGNFMNFTDDACMYMFTRGQAAYMRQYLTTVLPEMGETPLCTDAPHPYTPAAALPGVYPNPNNGHFVVENRSGQPGRLLLYAANGQLLLDIPAATPFTLVEQAASLPAGVYYVRLETVLGASATSVVIYP
jgi:hypothetical protein